VGRLQDKVALVTGASAGIGRATAKVFAVEEAKLVVGARREELARSVLYLASDDSAFVTGTASLVDGRASITRS
jgi:NAD(P)-dependent dehydrogenase (short-subunit alcohol dehydrogenase family)